MLRNPIVTYSHKKKSAAYKIYHHQEMIIYFSYRPFWSAPEPWKFENEGSVRNPGNKLILLVFS